MISNMKEKKHTKKQCDWFFQNFLRAKYVICLSHNERGDLLTGDSNGTVYVWGDGGNKITNFIKHGHDVCTIVWRCWPMTGILIVLICWFGMTMNFYLHFPAVCLLVFCCLFVCLLLFIGFLFLFLLLFICLFVV